MRPPRFRWSGWRGVAGRGAGVSLVLTSLSHTRLSLAYSEPLQYYHSELVHLPMGYHQAFILVASQVGAGKGQPRYETARNKLHKYIYEIVR